MIKNRIKVILAEKGIKQTTLAEGIGVKRVTLSSAMNGHQSWTLETAFKVARFLNLRIEDIFYMDGEDTDSDLEICDFQDMIEKMKKIYLLYQSNTINASQLNKLYDDMYNEFNKLHPGADINELSQTLDDYFKLPPPIMEMLLEI